MKLKTWLPVSPTMPVGASVPSAATHEGGQRIAEHVDMLAALEKLDLADLARRDDLFRNVMHRVARKGMADRVITPLARARSASSRAWAAVSANGFSQ